MVLVERARHLFLFVFLAWDKRFQSCMFDAHYAFCKNTCTGFRYVSRTTRAKQCLNTLQYASDSIAFLTVRPESIVCFADGQTDAQARLSGEMREKQKSDQGCARPPYSDKEFGED